MQIRINPGLDCGSCDLGGYAKKLAVPVQGHNSLLTAATADQVEHGSMHGMHADAAADAGWPDAVVLQTLLWHGMAVPIPAPAPLPSPIRHACAPRRAGDSLYSIDSDARTVRH